MTNRFECDKGSRIIIDNETKLHYIMTLDWECSLVTKLLNHFAEENEQLKDKYNEQSVEYEGLEEQIERLLNFKDKVFELFNREIEHNTDAILQATNEDVDCATIGFHTKMLKRYKKELSE